MNIELPNKNNLDKLRSIDYNLNNISNIYSNCKDLNSDNYIDILNKTNKIHQLSNFKQEEKDNSNINYKDEIKIKKNSKFNKGIGINYNLNQQISGLSSINNTYETETKKLNNEINAINFNNTEKENYYNNILGSNKTEINNQKEFNKRDNIKKLFSTLNFPNKNSSYYDDYYYDKEKKNLTINHNYDNHYMKSFMKTYEECKAMHSHILRNEKKDDK